MASSVSSSAIGCDSAKTPAIFVVGATASGKTRLGIEIARSLSGEIISVDSLQVYDGFRIGGAQPSDSELAQVPHHLVGSWDPAEPRTVAQYCEAVKSIKLELERRAVPPVLVGGSTLYLSGLLSGLAELPAESPVLREKLEALSKDEIFARLSKRDAENIERYQEMSRRRLVRAAEVLELSSRSIFEFWGEEKPVFQSCLVLVLCWERNALYERINHRSAEMMSQGLREEAMELAKQLPASNRLLASLGYAQVLENPDSSNTELAQLIAQQTRRFAKRQGTFWRNEPTKRAWRCFPEKGEGLIVGAEAPKSMPRARSEGFSCFQWSFQKLLNHIKQPEGFAGLGVSVLYLDARELFSELL